VAAPTAVTVIVRAAARAVAAVPVVVRSAAGRAAAALAAVPATGAGPPVVVRAEVAARASPATLHWTAQRDLPATSSARAEPRSSCPSARAVAEASARAEAEAEQSSGAREASQREQPKTSGALTGQPKTSGVVAAVLKARGRTSAASAATVPPQLAAASLEPRSTARIARIARIARTARLARAAEAVAQSVLSSGAGPGAWRVGRNAGQACQRSRPRLQAAPDGRSAAAPRAVARTPAWRSGRAAVLAAGAPRKWGMRLARAVAVGEAWAPDQSGGRAG